MPNRSYEKGKRREYKVMNILKGKGYTVLRSAGSHSPIDVVGIHKIQRRIILVQCKTGKFSNKEKERLIKENEEMKGMFMVDFYVDVPRK